MNYGGHQIPFHITTHTLDACVYLYTVIPVSLGPFLKRMKKKKWKSELAKPTENKRR